MGAAGLPGAGGAQGGALDSGPGWAPPRRPRAGRPRPSLAHLGWERGPTRRRSRRGHPAWGRGRRAG